MKELIETQHEVDEQEAAEYDAIAMDVGELPPDCVSFSLFLIVPLCAHVGVIRVLQCQTRRTRTSRP